jgi:alpha-glucosidase
MYFLNYLLVCSVSCLAATGQVHEVKSPDGRLQARFFLNATQRPVYTVAFQGKEMIRESGLGFVWMEGGLLRDSMQLAPVSQHAFSETYPLVTGKMAQARNQYQEITLACQEKRPDGRQYQIQCRAYNDGIAFRYVFTGQPAGRSFHILSELTEFNFAGDYPCWTQHLPHFNWNYEKGFDKVSLASIYGTPELSFPIMQYLSGFDFPAAFNREKLVGLPLVIEVPNGPAVAVAEADLRDYPGMYLQNVPGRPSLTSVLAPLPQGNGVRAIIQTPQESPWRVLMVGENTGKLIESPLILNLNRPNQLADVSWIKPGKSTWDFLSGRAVKGVDFKGGMNMETMQYYIDFASEYKLEYFVMDDGWCPDVVWFKENPTADPLKTVPGIDIPALVKYATGKNVGLILWARWDNIRENMDKAFAGFQQWGVKGVKIDFMDSDDQYMVNWYEKCLATAAKYHLLINFHGAYKPTGLIRTYPNYITQEGVKGLEWSNTTTTLTSKHNVTLAFTRMLLGPMDYTPGGFNNVKPEDYEYSHFNVMTTRAHQLAMCIVYESPLTVLADAPHVYRENPESAFYKGVPSSWDETRYLAGKTGEYIVLARRKGKDWYIGGMGDENERTVSIPLSFLESKKKYSLTSYQDGKEANLNPKQVEIRKETSTAQSVLNIKLAANGGFALQLLSDQKK